MTTKDLIDRLRELDPLGNCTVLERRCSDNGLMEAGSWSTDYYYPQNNGEWYTKEHYRFDRGQTAQSVRAVHYEGN